MLMRSASFKALVLIPCLIGSLAARANAQDFYAADSSVPVARHIKQNSGTRFSANERSAATMEYDLSRDLPRGAGTYDALPNCSKGEVRRKPVVYDTPNLKFFDLLFYDYHSSEQVRRADAWEKPAAPFLEGDLFNPYREKNNLQQELARFFSIRCLPTRVHYIYENGKRYEEYREGPRAWEPEG